MLLLPLRLRPRDPSEQTELPVSERAGPSYSTTSSSLSVMHSGSTGCWVVLELPNQPDDDEAAEEEDPASDEK